MKIIGEETIEYEGHVNFDYSQLKTDQLSSQIFDGFTKTHIDLNKAIVWIDPIDATSQFVIGKMNWVTILLGISVDGEPMVGIIGRFYD